MTGYQLQYASNEKFTSAKTITISKNSVVSQKITGLIKSKKYSLRIRSYKTVSGKKYYAPWSNAVAITVTR